MATWGLHIRIAQRLIEQGIAVDQEAFLVGNIGPDCGLANEDGTRFDPPASVTHWCDGSKLNIEAALFARKYLTRQGLEIKEWSFYLGYYVHLLTDKKFSRLVQDKIDNDPLYLPLQEDNDFIWTIKKDWYDLDRRYFLENDDSLFFSVFTNIEEFPDYLEYYPQGAVITQIRFIIEFYRQKSVNLDREYLYLSESEMDRFLEEVIGYIAAKLADYI